jgi:uncharacterized protein (DUF1499 family)
MNPYELLFEIDLLLSTYDNQTEYGIEEIYCYMNHNNKTVSVYVNDEQKLKLNIVKILYNYKGIKPKLFFDYVDDVKLKIDRNKNILKILYYKKEK